MRWLWDVLLPRERTTLLIVLAATVVGSVAEAATIGLVVPFIGVLAEPASVNDSAWRIVSARLPIMPPVQTVLVLGAALLGMFLVKNAYLTVLVHQQYRFVFSAQAALSKRLLLTYLRAPWTFHTQRNSAELLRDVNVEVPLVFGNVLNPLMVLATELLVTTAVVLLLVIVEPVSSLLCLVLLGGMTAVFYVVVRRRTTRLGERQFHLRADMIKAVTQGLGAAKETKVLGREEFFATEFARSADQCAAANTYLATISQLPRFFLETLVIGGIVGILGVMAWQGRDTAEALPMLALFAVAAFRLMPAMNRIVSCVANIRYHGKALRAVHHSLTTLTGGGPIRDALGRETSAATFERLELRTLSYRYAGAERDAVSAIDLIIPRGAAVGITGPSGAGKTTLVDVIVGLLEPVQGDVFVDGEPVRDLATWRRRIGYVPQQVYLLDDSVRRNVAFGLPDADIDDERVWAALRSAQLERLVRGERGGLEVTVGERGVRFSGGERQRLGIARALYHDPDVLVLDEITASLDVETEQEVTRAIRSLKGMKTLIIITHRLSTIEHCDMVYELAEGRLVRARTTIGAGGVA
ncbi:MAG: ABC transporter ATP-binding protein [Vicinamibacterales bacterium]